MNRFQNQKNRLQVIILIICMIFILSGILYTPPPSIPIERFRMLVIVIVACLLWIFEAVPIQLTALIIIFLEFTFKIMPFTIVLNTISHPVGLLLLAGFSLSAGIQKSGIDTFIISKIIKLGGSNIRRLLFLIMAVVGFLSMWISNTATCAIMMPFATSVVLSIEGPRKNVGIIFTIGIAYAATIGGVGTPVGTTTNPIVIASVKEMLNIDITFIKWLGIGFPFVVTLIPLGWLLLINIFPPETDEIQSTRLSSISKAPSIRNSMSRRMLIIFFLLVLLWIAEVFISLPEYWIYKSSFFIAILLYVPYVGILDWSDAKKHVDWGVIVIVAGGLALGKGLVGTDTINWIIQSVIPGLNNAPLLLIISFLAFMTAASILLFCGITATASTFVPLSIILALSLEKNPVIFASVAGIASCFAFLLPASTAPNAIAFGTGFFTTRDMLLVGIPMLIVSTVCVILIAMLVWQRIM